MKRSIWVGILSVGLGLQISAFAAEKGKSLGQVEYEDNCAVCHGQKGSGDGVFAQYLKSPPPSLRTLKSRNGGVFPAERVYRSINAGIDSKGHGPAEMPIWGRAYRAEAQTGDPFFSLMYSEERVRARILTLVDFISKLQD